MPPVEIDVSVFAATNRRACASRQKADADTPQASPPPSSPRSGPPHVKPDLRQTISPYSKKLPVSSTAKEAEDNEHEAVMTET